MAQWMILSQACIGSIGVVKRVPVIRVIPASNTETTTHDEQSWLLDKGWNLLSSGSFSVGMKMNRSRHFTGKRLPGNQEHGSFIISEE